MNKTLTTAVLALMSSAIVSVVSIAPAQPKTVRPELVPGPGGVAYAVKAFLELQEGAESTAPLLVDSSHDLEFGFADNKLEQTKKGEETVAAFLDVGMLGKPIAARTAKDFVQQLGQHVASKKQDERVLTHQIDAIRANCQSEACSLAVVEFTRIYTQGGGKQMHVPMRATALLRYEQAEGSNFRIYHWHASRAR